MSLIIEQVIASTIEDVIKTNNQDEISCLENCFEQDNFDNLTENYQTFFMKNLFIYENSLLIEAGKGSAAKRKTSRAKTPKMGNQIAKQQFSYLKKQSKKKNIIQKLHSGLSNQAKKRLSAKSKTRTVLKVTNNIGVGALKGIKKGIQKVNSKIYSGKLAALRQKEKGHLEKMSSFIKSRNDAENIKNDTVRKEKKKFHKQTIEDEISQLDKQRKKRKFLYGDN